MRYLLIAAALIFAAAAFYLYQNPAAHSFLLPQERPAPGESAADAPTGTEKTGEAKTANPQETAEEGPAPGQPVFSAATYACTPEGFTLKQVSEGFLFEGALETPTPGYNYIAQDITETDTGADITLHLRGPGDMAAQVISSMEISHMYQRDVPLETFNVRID